MAEEDQPLGELGLGWELTGAREGEDLVVGPSEGRAEGSETRVDLGGGERVGVVGEAPDPGAQPTGEVGRVLLERLEISGAQDEDEARGGLKEVAERVEALPGLGIERAEAVEDEHAVGLVAESGEHGIEVTLDSNRRRFDLGDEAELLGELAGDLGR